MSSSHLSYNAWSSMISDQHKKTTKDHPKIIQAKFLVRQVSDNNFNYISDRSYFKFGLL